MWLTLTIIATVCFATARLLQKSILNNPKHDPIAYAIYFQLLVATVLLPVAIINGFSLPSFEHLWGALISTAILYCLVNIFTYNSLKRIPVSEFTILFATTPIWTLLSSTLLLQESTHFIKLLGIVLTVSGIIIAFYTGKKLRFTRYHLFALLAAMVFGFTFTNDAYMLKHFTVPTYSFLYFFWPGLVLACIYHKRVKKIVSIAKDGFVKSILPSILFAIAALSINNAYQLGGETSQISTITQASTMLVIIFSFFFLQERSHMGKKLIGGAIVCAGCILVQVT